MAIRKCGPDKADIEHLRTACCTDEEINDLNKARVQEQVQEEADESGENTEEISDPESLGTDPAPAQAICIIFACTRRILQHFKTDTLGTDPQIQGSGAKDQGVSVKAPKLQNSQQRKQPPNWVRVSGELEFRVRKRNQKFLSTTPFSNY